jgi:hypothetical protein
VGGARGTMTRGTAPLARVDRCVRARTRERMDGLAGQAPGAREWLFLKSGMHRSSGPGLISLLDAISRARIKAAPPFPPRLDRRAFFFVCHKSRAPFPWFLTTHHHGRSLSVQPRVIILELMSQSSGSWMDSYLLTTYWWRSYRSATHSVSVSVRDSSIRLL